MADSKTKSKTELVEPSNSRWYLSGFVLTERGLTALVGSLQDIRAEVVETLSTTIDFVDATGQRGAKLAHRLLDRADGFAAAGLETTESAITALLARARRTSRDAAEVAARSAGDLAA
jgi:hypothetical protein